MSSRLSIVGVSTVLSMAGLCMAADRSYVAGNYAIALDGAPCGFTKSVEGGSVSAVVIDEVTGSDAIVRKHIGQPVFEPVSIEFGFTLQNPALHQWVSQTIAGASSRHDLTVTAVDYDMKPISERTFAGSLITAITFPELNAGAPKGGAGQLTITVAPEMTKHQAVDSTKPAGVSAGPGAQKGWSPSNFRIQVDGIDTARVLKIASFTVSQTVVPDAVGEAREAQKQPGKLHLPNLVITVPDSGAQDWVTWHNDFVIKGNNGQEKEKSGVIEFLSADLKTVIARLSLAGVGIIKVQPVKQEASADQVSKSEVHLYVEKMDFKMEGPVAGSTGAAATGGDAAATPPAGEATEATGTVPPVGTAAAPKPAARPTLLRPRALPQ